MVLKSSVAWPHDRRPAPQEAIASVAAFTEQKVHLRRELHNLASDSAPNSQTDVEQAGMLGHGEITAVLRRGFTEAGLAGPRPFPITALLYAEYLERTARSQRQGNGRHQGKVRENSASAWGLFPKLLDFILKNEAGAEWWIRCRKWPLWK